MYFFKIKRPYNASFDTKSVFDFIIIYYKA